MGHDEMFRSLGAILDPIRQHDRPMLREKVRQLKQTDGEGWAIGEMLERACIHLDACQLSRKRDRDVKKGYNPPPASLQLPQKPPPPPPPKE